MGIEDRSARLERRGNPTLKIHVVGLEIEGDKDIGAGQRGSEA